MLFGQININNGQSFDTSGFTGEKQAHKNAKRTILQSMFPDSRSENKIDIKLDYFYVTFASTFNGLKEMLRKKTNLNETEKINEAIEDFLELLRQREIT